MEKELIKRIEEQAVEIAALKAAMRRAIPYIGYMATVPRIKEECERVCEWAKYCEEHPEP